MYPRYSREEWYCPPVHWYWNGSYWSYIGAPAGSRSYMDRNYVEQYGDRNLQLQDYGPNPYVVNIEKATEINTDFRLALWTGHHLQTTLMSIPSGEDIGLEKHEDTDQFLRIEEGRGIVKIGKTQEAADLQKHVRDDDAIFIPAGYWHNVINTGNKPLKLYSIYAPPHHPRGTIHKTSKNAMESEHHR